MVFRLDFKVFQALQKATLTVFLARELGPKGIRVNAVAPGITLTDMMKSVPKEVIDPLIKQIPLRRLGQPEDIANAFVFLASGYQYCQRIHWHRGYL